MRRFAIMLALMCLFALSSAVRAQEGCEPTGDGPVQQQKSGVKKIGDTFTLSWIAPTALADADCTPISNDPAFALTSYEVYIEVNAPAQSGINFPAVATLPPDQLSLTGTLDFEGLRPSDEVYYAIAACNQFGCSNLSEQPWHKLGGPPGKVKEVVAD